MHFVSAWWQRYLEKVIDKSSVVIYNNIRILLFWLYTCRQEVVYVTLVGMVIIMHCNPPLSFEYYNLLYLRHNFVSNKSSKQQKLVIDHKKKDCSLTIWELNASNSNQETNAKKQEGNKNGRIDPGRSQVDAGHHYLRKRSSGVMSIRQKFKKLDEDG